MLKTLEKPRSERLRETYAKATAKLDAARAELARIERDRNANLLALIAQSDDRELQAGRDLIAAMQTRIASLQEAADAIAAEIRRAELAEAEAARAACWRRIEGRLKTRTAALARIDELFSDLRNELAAIAEAEAAIEQDLRAAGHPNGLRLAAWGAGMVDHYRQHLQTIFAGSLVPHLSLPRPRFSLDDQAQEVAERILTWSQK